MIGSKTYKDGVLQGVVIAPVTGESIEIRYIGTPMDLAATARFLGLEPVEGAVENADPDNPVMSLTDGRGGYATLQPAERASDLLHTVAEMTAQLGGSDPDSDGSMPWD
jgi:hypothetical protein